MVSFLNIISFPSSKTFLLKIQKENAKNGNVSRLIGKTKKSAYMQGNSSNIIKILQMSGNNFKN